MSTNRAITLVLCLLLLFSLAACSSQASTTSPSDPSTPSEPTPPTSDPPSFHESYTSEEAAIEAFLNDRANNGFISNNFYNSPAEINLYRVFYNGASIKQTTDQWAEAEIQAVMNATGWHTSTNYLVKIPYEAANAFLLEKSGLSFADFSITEEPLRYVEAYDAIYLTRTDLNYHRVSITKVKKEKNGLRTVYYTMSHIDPTDPYNRPVSYILTLQKTDSGYRFISNVEVDPSKPQGIDEPFLSVLTGEKTFYHAESGEARNISYYKRLNVPYLYVDIDADNKKELVIAWGYYDTESQGNLLILREENGVAFGYDVLLSNWPHFNTNGSYGWAKSDSEKRSQGCSVLQLSGDTYISVEIHRYDHYYATADVSAYTLFYVNNEPATQMEFNAAVAGEERAEWSSWILNRPPS